MADYAISNVDRRIVYTGSAGVGPYAFNFEVLDQTDIAVYKNATLLVLTTNYTVSINPSTGVGSVTLNVAATSSDTITIVGARAIRRTTDFTTGGDLFANSLNDELDSLTIFSQQVAETAERGIKAPVTDPTDINMTLPAKATRAGTVLAFNATTGNPEAGPSIGSVTTVADQSANINTVATNIASVNTVAGNNSNINTVAGISGNVTTVAGISANVTSVAGNSSNINTVAGISGNVTTVAGVSSSVSTVAGISANVTTVAGISSNVTTVAGVSADVTTVATNIAAVNTNATNIVAIQNASTNATNAAASAVSAGNAQTAAEAARDATLAAYDNFDDRYLGSKTSNPTLDNDGNALVAGSLYFNSVSGAMQVYTGSAWVAAYVSGTGFLASANNLSDVASTSSARTNLGLGTIATQAASSVAITGGSINGTTIGASTPSTGAFSNISVNSNNISADNSLGFRNRIINGDMRIDQRNAGAAVTANGSYVVDRFLVQNGTDGAFSAQQDTSAPVGFVNSIKWTTTTADGTLTTTQQASIQQRIEGTNVSDLAFGTANAKTVTISFWVRSSLTGTFGGSLRNDATDRSYPFTYSISVADTWEQKSVTIAGDTSGTWLTTTGVGLTVTWGLGSGPDRSGTSGAWNSNNNNTATGAVSVIGTLNATFYITGVQLEVGSVATPFERRPYGTELSLCQRYYYRDTSPSANNTMHSAMNAVCNSTTTAYCYGTFPVIMRAAPTALEQTGTAGNYNLFVNNASVTLNAVPTFGVASTRGASVLATAASGFVLNAAGILRGASGAYLGWSAEL